MNAPNWNDARAAGKVGPKTARRARVILMLADGASYTTITTAVGCHPAYVVRWKQRFEAARLAGLEARYRGQPARVRTPAMEARILAKTQTRAARWQHALDARASWRRC